MLSNIKFIVVIFSMWSCLYGHTPEKESAGKMLYEKAESATDDVLAFEFYVQSGEKGCAKGYEDAIGMMLRGEVEQVSYTIEFLAKQAMQLDAPSLQNDEIPLGWTTTKEVLLSRFPLNKDDLAFLEKYEKFQVVQHFLGQIAEKNGQYEEALKAYRQAGSFAIADLTALGQR